jgi:ubiquinone/menaquinone biosynthesis C-methylase UbiE
MDSYEVKLESARRFGENASHYATSKPHGDAASLRALVELVQPQPWDVMLDVATGAGHTALAFAPYVKGVVAYDLSQGMLDQTLSSAEERGLGNVLARLGDAEEMPFEDGSFEIVACRIAAHHFPDQPKFFRECRRVLKPGGKFVFVDNYGPGSSELAKRIEEIEKLRDWTHHRTWRIEDLRRQIAEAGFNVLREEIGYFEETGGIEFEDWCRRIGTPNEAVEKLRPMFLNAPPDLARALRITVEGGTITFLLPKVTILAAYGE